MIVWGGMPYTATGGIYTPVIPTISGVHTNACPSATVTLAADAHATYQWYRDGQAIPGTAASSATYEAAVGGTYAVDVSNSDGCSGTSAGYPVRIAFCAAWEVSPPGADFPTRLIKDAASPTGYFLYFQRRSAAAGYNIYEGILGGYYSHANSLGNVCNTAVTDLGTGLLRAAITPSAGDHYYLVTAFGDGVEGPSGYASSGAEIPTAHSTCAP